MRASVLRNMKDKKGFITDIILKILDLLIGGILFEKADEFFRLIVLILIAVLLLVISILSLHKEESIIFLISFWSVLLGCGFLNCVLFTVDFNFELYFWFVLPLGGATSFVIYRLYSLISKEAKEPKELEELSKKPIPNLTDSELKKLGELKDRAHYRTLEKEDFENFKSDNPTSITLQSFIKDKNKKIINITLIGIFFAVLWSIYIPNLIPHIINGIPKGYRVDEKMLAHNGTFGTVTSQTNNENEKGRFIYEHDKYGWVMYVGEYKNYIPDGKGIMVKDGITVYDGYVSNYKREGTGEIYLYYFPNDDIEVSTSNSKFMNCKGKCKGEFKNDALTDGTWTLEEHDIYEKYKGRFEQNNKPSFGTLTFKNNDDKYLTYTGAFDIHGDFIGNGELEWTDGSKYEGEFQESEMTNGVLMIKSNTPPRFSEEIFKNAVKFDGTFQNGKPKEGTLTFNSEYNKPYKSFTGIINEKGFFEGEGSVELRDGKIINGYFESNELNGVVTVDITNFPEYDNYQITFANNTEINIFLEFKAGNSNPNKYKSYSGTIYNGDITRFEEGILVYADDNPEYKSYDGTFELNGEFKKGVLYYKDDNKYLEKYDGEFENNERNGKGTLTYKRGNPYELKEYDGYFKNDKPDDSDKPDLKGKLTWNNEDEYYGKFKEGYFHGNGKFSFYHVGPNIGILKSYLDGEFEQGRFFLGKWLILIANKNGGTRQYYWHQYVEEKWDYIFEKEITEISVFITDGDNQIINHHYVPIDIKEITLKKGIENYIRKFGKTEVYW